VRNRFLFSTLLAAIAVPLFTGLTFGLSWFSHNSSTKSTQVDIVYNSKLANGMTLQPGSYKLEIPLNTQTPVLKFYQDGKLVASVPAKVKPKSEKAPSTEVDYRDQGGSHIITSVEPGGLSESLVISRTNTMKSGS
jgi:hypothetical protein